MRKQPILLDARVGEVNRRDDVLDRIDALLDWGLLGNALLKVESRNEVGRRTIAPMILFRMLLLQAFYNISDGEVEIPVADRISFRRFVGRQLDERVPDETSLVRIRERIREAGHTDKLPPVVMKHIEAKGLVRDSGRCDLGEGGGGPAGDSIAARRRLGERVLLMHRGRRNRPLDAMQEAFNRIAASIRCRVETVFGRLKRSCGFHRVRYRSLAACNLEL